MDIHWDVHRGPNLMFLWVSKIIKHLTKCETSQTGLKQQHGHRNTPCRAPPHITPRTILNQVFWHLFRLGDRFLTASSSHCPPPNAHTHLEWRQCGKNSNNSLSAKICHQQRQLRGRFTWHWYVFMSRQSIHAALFPKRWAVWTEEHLHLNLSISQSDLGVCLRGNTSRESEHCVDVKLDFLRAFICDWWVTGWQWLEDVVHTEVCPDRLVQSGKGEHF